jgi:hypothetical protein
MSESIYSLSRDCKGAVRNRPSCGAGPQTRGRPSRERIVQARRYWVASQTPLAVAPATMAVTW